MSELCRRFAVSRPTGYGLVRRFRLEGDVSVEPRSSAPLSCPHRTPEDLVAEILTLKRRHPHWGPVTLRAYLRKTQPNRAWPATSTFGEWLKRHHLVRPRRRSAARTPPQCLPYAQVHGPNDVWSADFKGQFAMGDGRYCYPLTITDNYSRYLLCCQGLYRPSSNATRTGFERTFRQYGLPRAIRTDNGAPFASVGLGGLSALSVWLLKLGIQVDRIRPGRPQQNGRHERMHRTLKAETAAPPCANLAAQQRAFNRFARELNGVRPHQGIADAWPIELYQASPRPYPERVPEVEYPDGFEVRRVRSHGEMRWHGSTLFVSETLAGEWVGLRAIDNDRYDLYFATLPLAIVDDRLGRIIKPGKRTV